MRAYLWTHRAHAAGDISRRQWCRRRTRLTIAYHAVLHQIGLEDCEDGATLKIAKRIVDLATLGKRDPEPLIAATVEALSK
jgi:hypothetical protein